MVSINISLTNADAELAETLARIDGEARVKGALDPSGVEGVVAMRRNEVEPPESASVDLIAHAVGGVMQFGDWVIDNHEQASAALKNKLGASAFDQIRLLGCNTARTKAGQDAILHLAQAFPGALIWGATVPLYADDFGPSGLVSQGVLAEHAALPQPVTTFSSLLVESWFRRFRPHTHETLDEVLSNLRPETLEQATFELRRTRPERRWTASRFSNLERHLIFDFLVPELAVAPGLLTLPEYEALFPAATPGHVHRATILLGGSFVRLYPITTPHGVIVRTTQPLVLAGGSPVHV